MNTPRETDRVATVLQTELYTLTPDTGLNSALRLAQEHNIDHMLVLENGTLSGIVSRGDLVKPGHSSVKETMSSPVLCIKPDTFVGEALLIMEQQHVSCLAVVSSEFLLGTVTRQALQGRPPKDPLPLPIQPAN